MTLRKQALLVLATLAIIVPLAAGCSSQPAATATAAPAAAQSAGSALQGTITISGAWALYPMIQRWADEFHKLNPGVQFDVSAGGAGKGMADTLSGAVDIGMISRAITPEEEAKGAFWLPVTRDAVFAVVSAQNPALADILKKGVTRAAFAGLYISDTVKTWGQVVGSSDASQVHVYTRADSAGAADAWALYLGNKKQEDLKGIGVSGDPGIGDAVAKDPLGIGYNNLTYAFDIKTGKPAAGLVVVPIDANGNGVADPEEILDTMDKAVQAVTTGRYPAPPARDLNLVTKGQPTAVVRAFLQWILADGQQFVGEAGFVQLRSEQLQTALKKLGAQP
jgi:phosphate transport system substrate-binding protein